VTGSGGSGGRESGELVVALDIGGTKTAAGCVDRDGRLLHRVSKSTAQESARSLLDAVAALVMEECCSAPGPVAGVGVSVAGAVEPASGDVHYAPNIPAWQDFPLGRLLSDAVRLPVAVGFDGHVAALGEHWVGAGRGTRHMVLLVIGTGIGGGMILDGTLYRGCDNLAGAAGWMVVDPAALDSGFSRSKGNLESISSGPGLAEAVRQTAEETLAAAKAGDEDARKAIHHAASSLGYAVAGIVSLLNPELVVLGGGLGSTGVFLAEVREVVSAVAQPTSRRRVRIVTAMLGPDAGLIGAARMVFEQLQVIDHAPSLSTSNKEVAERDSETY
jgi:glucokinase